MRISSSSAKKITITVSLFCAMAFSGERSIASNWNSEYTRISDEKTFRNYIVGKVIDGRCTIVLTPQNAMNGTCKDGKELTGKWWWSGKNFCRSIRVSGKTYDGCQKFELDFKKKKIRTTSIKTGNVNSSNLTDIDFSTEESTANNSALEAEKRKTEQLQQELAALQAKQASAQPVVQESSSSAVAVVSSPEQSTVSVSSSSTKWRNAKTPQEAQAFANDIQSSIVMFMAIADVIKKQPASLKDRVLGVVDGEIARLRAEKELLQQQLSSRFSTPIRPSNANLAVSAFRAADTFPKIPFYVPGTNEIGEMLVIPRVTDDGFLNYKFDFLDPTATYNKVRDTISIPHKNVNSVITGLQKVDEWTKVAQENNINRRVEKSAACVPEGKCEDKKQGISSTEVMFQIYEDGSTAGRIQRNKGKFSVGYNMSVESSILLSAYLTYMRDVGAKEFNIGVMSDDEVKKLFN